LKTMRAFIKDTLLKWHVLTYSDAVQRLGSSFFATTGQPQLHPDLKPETVTPLQQMPQFFQPAVKMSGFTGEEAFTPKKKRRKLVEPQELALKRLAEERRREAEKLRSLQAVEEPALETHTDWLILSRLEPGPYIVDVQLSETEAWAVREEMAAQNAWEESGGREAEEKILKKWRKSQLLRRQNYLLKRGAARWLHRRKGEERAELNEDLYTAMDDPYQLMMEDGS